MTIKRLLTLLKEYDNNGYIMKLASMGGNKAAGKSYDNQITGKTSFYKTDKVYHTRKEKQYRELGDAIQRLKQSNLANPAPTVLTGLPLQQFIGMLPTLKKDENGEYILPFGDNVRVFNSGNVYFLKYSKAQKIDAPITDTSINNQQTPNI